MIEKYPLPNIDELLSELRNAKFFSKLDLKSAYYQLELEESSRYLTTFVTHEGLYRYKRVCFGLASAPTCFQRVMSSVLQGIKGVQCFIDDIIVYGVNRGEHDKRLHAVLTKLRSVGMKLNSKCEFNVGSIEILGHVVDHKGLSPNPDLVRAINEAPTPTNRDQVKSFLGLVGYYSKFIRHFATRVQYIRDTMVADAFEWTKEAEVAFQAVKHEIINSTALALFDPDRETIVTTDASGYGIGSVMTQIQGGKRSLCVLHPVN